VTRIILRDARTQRLLSEQQQIGTSKKVRENDGESHSYRVSDYTPPKMNGEIISAACTELLIMKNYFFETCRE
jgi:hypothetical protein